MRKNKKGAGVGWFWGGAVVLIIIVALSFVGVINLGAFKGSFKAIGEPGDTSVCPDDGLTTVYVKVFDPWSSTPTTAVAGSDNLVFFDVTEGIILNTSTSATSWTSYDMDCGHIARIYSKTSAGTLGSAVSEDLRLSGNTEYVSLYAGKLSKMTVKLKDIDGDDWEYGFADAIENGTNATTGVDMNATSFYNDASMTAFAVGSDGELNLELFVKSATNRESGNDKGQKNTADGYSPMGLRSFMCVDLGGTTNGQEWDSNELKVNINGGTSLPDVKSSIDAVSRDYITLENSEACYNIGDTTDTFKEIGFSVKAKSANDPDATDDDIKIYFFSEGTYQSSEDLDGINTGIFTDATTQRNVVDYLSTAIEDAYIILQIS